MANKQVLKVRKQRKVRLTRSEEYLFNHKYMGDEPTYNPTREMTMFETIDAYNWYQYMANDNDVREYLINWLEKNGTKDQIRRARTLPDTQLPTQAAYKARMLMRGAMLSSKSIERMKKEINSALSRVKDEVEVISKPKSDEPKVNIQDRIREKASFIVDEIEKYIDANGWKGSIYSILQSNECNSILAKHVRDFFAPIADEANLLISNECPSNLLEGYLMPADQLESRAEFYSNIIADCDRFRDNAKKTKVVRKKKEPSVEKKISKVKILKDSNEYKITSIAVEKILKAEGCILFNTKYKTLTHLIAKDRGGLDIKGTTIQNIHEDSATKRMGRKTEERIKNIMNGGKRVLQGILKELSDAPLQERLNENTLILKVI